MNVDSDLNAAFFFLKVKNRHWLERYIRKKFLFLEIRQWNRREDPAKVAEGGNNISGNPCIYM